MLNKPTLNEQILYECTVRYLGEVKFIEIETVVVVASGCGEKEMESCLLDRALQFYKMKNSVDCLHNNVNILNTTEIYLEMVGMVMYVGFLTTILKEIKQ